LIQILSINTSSRAVARFAAETARRINRVAGLRLLRARCHTHESVRFGAARQAKRRLAEFTPR
jgi:hypothetical protein